MVSLTAPPVFSMQLLIGYNVDSLLPPAYDYKLQERFNYENINVHFLSLLNIDVNDLRGTMLWILDFVILIFGISGGDFLKMPVLAI